MNYLVIETISTIAFFILITIGINFLSDKDAFDDHPTLFRIVSIICFTLATACAAYFILDIFVFNYKILGYAIFKLILFIIAIVIYCAGVLSCYKQVSLHGIGSLINIAVLIIFGALCVGGMETMDIEHREYKIYQQKVIAQEPKVTSTKYKILSLKDATNVEGSFSGDVNGRLSGNFLIMGGTIKGNQNGEIKNVNVYKFYYVADEKTNKILPKTINADETPIYPIEQGNTPYLLEIVSTPYSLDYNIDPAKECNFKEPIVTYELYLPADAIAEGFSLGSD